MKKYVEVQAAKEFALGYFPDPILRMAINRLLDMVPAADVVERVDYAAESRASAGMVSWLRDKADRVHDIRWGHMMKRIARRLENQERCMRWIPVCTPPEDGLVVLVTDGYRVDSGIYDAEECCFDVEHAFVDPNEVTGWKHLSSLEEVL